MPTLAVNRLAGGPALYATTIFLSAFLVFAIQPILGKVMLPRFGGSAAVWATCLCFFQSMLLLGYLYAYASINWLGARAQSWLHVALLVASGTALPLSTQLSVSSAHANAPAWQLLEMLLASAGMPYLLLASTGPLLQAWYAREADAASPYRLFAVSNLGSLLGLLNYPLLVEPALTIPLQSTAWSTGYLVFAILCAVLALRMPVARAVRYAPRTFAPAAPGMAVQLLWLLLATCPSILLVAITSYISENLAPIPLLWVVPLTLYLLTFILCFESSRWYQRRLFVPLLAAMLALMTYALIVPYRDLHLNSRIALFCAGLFVVAMTCHGELAALKPHPSQLTRFYLVIAAGGMLGGCFVSLAAPHIFDSAYELPIGMVAAALVLLAVLLRDRSSWLHTGRGRLKAIVAPLAILILAGALLWSALGTAKISRWMGRNFYGALQVVDYKAGQQLVRSLRHGAIVHGTQLVGPDNRRKPTSYYTADSGVALALHALRTDAPQRIGLVGLGTGTLAAYGRAGDEYRFYEINPLVVDVAREQFTYLADSAATVRVDVGDARLLLESQPVQGFDVLVIDAFSGDAIPLHLLTREAFAIYLRHLSPDGMLAVHVSNRYLDLAPVVKQAAEYFGREARIVNTPGDKIHIVYAASWVLVGAPSQFQSLEPLRAAMPISANGTLRAWTDDYSSLYAVIKR